MTLSRKQIQLAIYYSAMILFIGLVGCQPKSDSIPDSSQTDSTKNFMSTLIKSDYAAVNGINMYYEIHGSGFPLVLIHGGGSTINTTFGKILPHLAKNNQVIAVELQAHGHTSDRDAPESFDQDAEDVAALLKHLNIDRANIFGFSNGGNTAMRLSIKHPDKVNKLIIASSFFKREGMFDGFWDMMDNTTFEEMPHQLKEEFLKINNDSTALLNMFNKDANRMRGFQDWPDTDLKSIQASSLLISGDKDVAKPEHVVAMYRLIPHCQLAIIPGGHGTYLGEITTLNQGVWSQEFVVPIIQQFLDNKEK